jgi:hypothetical protein
LLGRIGWLSAGFKVHGSVLAASAALDQEQCGNGLTIGYRRMLMNSPNNEIAKLPGVLRM